MSITIRTHSSEIETFARVNCSKIVSSLAAAASASGTTAGASNPTVSDPTCSFPCKTCGRSFPSFQALGGHRASHKKAKPAICSDSANPAPAKTPKRHACKICGKEFLIGQALGGHMRFHQNTDPSSSSSAIAGSSTVTTEGSNDENSQGSNCDLKKRKNDDAFLPVSKKRNCLDSGLNTMRSEDDENDFLKLELRQPINNW